MAQQVAEANALQGQARNPVSGGEKGLTPYQVTNLVPHRQGGLTPYGRRVRLDDEGTPVTVPTPERLVGYDETGVASFLDDTGDLVLFHGSKQYAQRSSPFGVPLGSESSLVHMDTAGAYISRNAFLLFDRDRFPMEPLSVNVTAAPKAGSTTQQADSEETPIYDIHREGGTVIASGAGVILRSEDNGLTWERVHEVGGSYRSIDYGAGVWIASASSGGDEAVRSEDDGQTWTPIEVSTGSVINAVQAVVNIGGSTWLALGVSIWRSTNGGLNWTEVDDLSAAVHWQVKSAVVDTRSQGVILAPAYYTSNNEATQHVFASFDDGASWTTMEARAGAQAGPWKVQGGAVQVEYDGNQTVLLAGNDGRISQATVSSIFATPNQYEMRRFEFVTILSDTRVRRMKYNSIANRWVVVGTSADESEPRVWHSLDGINFNRIHGIEDAVMENGGTVVNSVTFTAEGNEIYVDDTGVSYLSGETFGFREGNYNVYTLVYFNSPAGRVVVDLRRSTLAFTEAFGGSIEVSAPSWIDIESSNPWLGNVPSDDLEHVLENLRYDVYVQEIAEPVDGVVPENTIRYAFTEPLSEDGGESSRTIDEMPLGRQLVRLGAPTTSVLERSLTAVHQGRVWGLAHQDESQWSVDADGISPEIANQFNRFVLTYSEVGWANLISDQSFIPIQPTQSTHFTGLVSTPMGLFVMFDNEIHVVTGDPAFDNVTVELFSDMVGNDYLLEEDRPVRPCKVGGTPFVVWGGKVWALSSSGAQEISATQWIPGDPFVQIAPEPQNRSLLALTQSGKVFRYILDREFWLTDPVTGPGDSWVTELMLPNCVCSTGNHTRFVEGDGDVFVTRTDGTPDRPYILWQSLDFGMPGRRKALHLVKLAFDAFGLWQQEWDRSDPAFNVSAVPNLTVLTLNDVIASIPPILRYPGDVADRSVGMLAWRTPVGLAKSDSFNLLLSLAGMDYHDAIRLPLRVYFQAGGELR